MRSASSPRFAALTPLNGLWLLVMLIAGSHTAPPPANGTTPSSSLIIARSAGAAYPALAMTLDNTHVVWASRGRVYYRSVSPLGVISVREAVRGSAYAVLPSVAVSRGVPCVAWTLGAVAHHTGRLRVSCRRDGRWNPVTDVSVGNLDETLTTIVATHKPAGYALVYGSAHGVFVRVSKDGLTWSNQRVVTRSRPQTWAVSIVEDHLGLHVAFVVAGRVYTTSSMNAGFAWAIPRRQPIPGEARRLSLARGRAGPVLFASTADAVYLVRSERDLTWSSPELIANPRHITRLTAAGASAERFSVAWIRGEAPGFPPTGLVVEIARGRFTDPAMALVSTLSRAGEGPNWATAGSFGTEASVAYASRRRGLVRLQRLSVSP